MGAIEGLINNYVFNFEPKTYADSSDYECKLDCSLGVNPAPLPQRILEALRKIPEHTVKHYPHGEDVVDCLIDKFSPLIKLEHGNFVMGAGSVDILMSLNGLFLDNKRKCFGVAPQFTAFVDDVHLRGATYEALKLQKENNYKLDMDKLIKDACESGSQLIYLDNPNNPTGQVVPLVDVERLVKAANDKGIAIIVDEAYGDYMPITNSALPLVNKYENLVVTKTMSKGYGLAGTRMGYAVGNKELMRHFQKLITIFNCNALARDLAVSMLSDNDFLPSLMTTVTEQKTKLAKSLTKLKLAHTEMSVPIMLLYSEDENLDLCRHLKQSGIATVSGASFDNLGANSVRLMLCEDVDMLIELLKDAEARL